MIFLSTIILTGLRLAVFPLLPIIITIAPVLKVQSGFLGQETVVEICGNIVNNTVGGGYPDPVHVYLF